MSMSSNKTVTRAARLVLLRHGEVASHRGDVPVTEPGLAHAERTGKVLGGIDGRFTVLFGGTRRTRETAEALCRGIGDQDRTGEPVESFALRNPDLYLAGTRVNMVSSHAALAEQIPGMTETEAEASEWWSTFLSHTDRIGWWLRDANPPGDTAHDVATRLLRFAASLTDPGPMSSTTVIGVTHSPVLRAVLHHATGADSGEPAYVTGVQITLTGSDTPRIQAFDPLADLPGDRT